MPNIAEPLTLSGTSKRGIEVPINPNWPSFFKVGFGGMGILAAFLLS
jgi:hypothetical protein